MRNPASVKFEPRQTYEPAVLSFSIFPYTRQIYLYLPKPYNLAPVISPSNGYRLLNNTVSDWLPVKGLESRYEISNTGDVRSLATGKLLAKRVIGNHESVLLYDGAKHKGYTIAKLLQSHFGIQRKVTSQVTDLEGEEWREIPDFEGLYWISNKGRIKSRNAGVRDKEMLVKLTDHPKGGYSVSLHRNNKKYTYSLHRLLGEVFIPNPLNKPMVIHLNGDKKDPRLENLAWVNNSESQKNAVALGLKEHIIGEENACSVAVLQLSSKTGKVLKRWGCIADVERELGIWHSNIAKVCRGKRATAGGYGWQYEED